MHPEAHLQEVPSSPGHRIQQVGQVVPDAIIAGDQVERDHVGHPDQGAVPLLREVGHPDLGRQEAVQEVACIPIVRPIGNGCLQRHGDGRHQDHHEYRGVHHGQHPVTAHAHTVTSNTAGTVLPWSSDTVETKTLEPVAVHVADDRRPLLLAEPSRDPDLHGHPAAAGRVQERAHVVQVGRLEHTAGYRSRELVRVDGIRRVHGDGGHARHRPKVPCEDHCDGHERDHGLHEAHLTPTVGPHGGGVGSSV